MPAATKNTTKIKKAKPNGVIDNSIGNYEKHLFFVKKANEMKALIKEVGRLKH